MSGRKSESNVEKILKKIGLTGHPRDAATMESLGRAIVHPGEVAKSPHLGEDDPLKISARLVMDDFEAVTNGMGRRGKNDDSLQPHTPTDPFVSWRTLTDAIEAFYSGDIAGMKKSVEFIPESTAASALRDVFETLSGRPGAPDDIDDFGETLSARRKELTAGLETLDEASAYPKILRNEIARCLPGIARENQEVAKRLYYWAMEVLAENEPISESDEMASLIPGSGEASRICALTSINYDIDRAFLAWLRSLEAELNSGKINSEETAVRLKIAWEIAEMAERQRLFTDEVISRACEMLNRSYNLLNKLLPELKPVPAGTRELRNWLMDSGRGPVNHRNLKPGNSLKKRQQGKVNQELLLFDEVSK